MPRRLITVWTDDRIDLMAKLWRQGFTCSQIANELGHTSKNAVIGKIHRLGLRDRLTGYGKRSPENIAAATERRNRRENERRRFNRKKYHAPPRSASIKCEEITPLHVSLFDLANDACRWPYGDGPFTFCGLRALGGLPYCGTHYVASVGVGTPSERSATKVSTSLLAVP